MPGTDEVGLMADVLNAVEDPVDLNSFVDVERALISAGFRTSRITILHDDVLARARTERAEEEAFGLWRDAA